MSRMIVKTDGLNLRSAPNFGTNDNIISLMPFAQEVTVINSPDGQTFWEVEVVVDGQTRRGFAGSRYLRTPLSETKEKLLKAAVKEWIDFNRGEGQEVDDPFYRRVGDYFSALDMNDDGRDTGHFWSAAFISFIIREAGYTNFKFSDAHADYIRDAKAKRLSNNATAPFWLFRLTEHKPQLGDLVCAWRANEERTYDNVPNHFFPSHTDVVVEIGNDWIKTIGGNVNQSVSQKTFALKSDGLLKEVPNLFAIMRNNS